MFKIKKKSFGVSVNIIVLPLNHLFSLRRLVLEATQRYFIDISKYDFCPSNKISGKYNTSKTRFREQHRTLKQHCLSINKPQQIDTYFLLFSLAKLTSNSQVFQNKSFLICRQCKYCYVFLTKLSIKYTE